jgi:iron complex transport system substrate-binding protein
VVSLIASSTETVCALGCGDRLVARSHECDHPEAVRELPCVTSPKFALDGASYAIDARVRALVEQGVSVYRVDAEALDRLAPDLLLTQTQCEVCAVSLRDVEEAVCAMVRSRPRIVSLEPLALADVWRDIRRVSEALGVPERGVQLVSRLRRHVDGIAERATALPDRPRVVCIEWIDPLMAAGHWIPELIAKAGGRAMIGEPGGHAPPIRWADIAAADPDVLWVTPCGFDLARTREEWARVASRDEVRTLRAVREERAFLGDGNAFFNRPGPRLAETLEILAEAMHPGAFRFAHEGKGWARAGQ